MGSGIIGVGSWGVGCRGVGDLCMQERRTWGVGRGELRGQGVDVGSWDVGESGCVEE